MLNKVTAYFQNAFLKVVRTIYLVPELWDEMKWSRSVAYVSGPTNIQYPVVPISHADRWPFARIVKPDTATVKQPVTPPKKDATVTELKTPRRARNGG